MAKVIFLAGTAGFWSYERSDTLVRISVNTSGEKSETLVRKNEDKANTKNQNIRRKPEVCLQDVLDGCDLYDVDLIGYPYTWERGRGTDGWVEVKLDRTLVDSSFMNTFTDTRLTNLEISPSDHSPLFLEPKKVLQVVTMKASRFKNVWIHEPMFKQIVKEKFWSIISEDLVSLVQQFFVRGTLEHGIGDANIVLIPKKKNPATMMDLHPISLCNVAYKVCYDQISDDDRTSFDRVERPSVRPARRRMRGFVPPIHLWCENQ
ncbi:hypothetical protein AgCh_031137 [Apium graveolens]